MAEQSDTPTGALRQMAECVERGKMDINTNIPPGSKGQPGVVELVSAALTDGVSAQTILNEGLLPGMQSIGKRFAANEVFIPEVLIAARAMKAGVELLKPAFAREEVSSRGVFILGTVRGDLHDIGKNLVAVILEGAGWRIEDLGVDCGPEKFLDALELHPDAAVGLSALLATTMVNMQETVEAIRAKKPEAVILIGGAPVSAEFAEQINASGYAADPNGAVELLDRLCPPAA